MPPKRKVPARRASTGKRVSFGRTTMASQPTTPSGRPRREAAVDIDYKISIRSTSALYNSPMNRAKIVQEAEATPVAKRRGRPPKASTTAEATSPKKSAKKTAAPTTNIAASKIPGRVGRPPKIEATPAAPKPTKRKRMDEEAPAAPPKKRGRPSATAATTASSSKSRKPLAVKAEKGATPVKSAAAASGAKRGPKPGTKRGAKAAAPAVKASNRGRPKKASDGPAEATIKDETDNDILEDIDDQYWLMKAEPETRMENGVDVAFPIDKLAAATEPEPWDGMPTLCPPENLLTKTGVRNYTARNNMRAMRKGDLAFFYHSNIKLPAIVGVMRIVEEHSVDESAFDPSHPYFDEKSSRDKPKWDCVKVEFVKKFEEPITLKKVQATSKLSKMQLVTGSGARLSVQKVRPSEWLHILKMAGEPEDLGVAEKKSGYEADTNGETDKEVVEESVGIEDEDVEDAENVEAAKLAAYGLPEHEVEKGDEAALPTPKDMLALEAATNGVTAGNRIEGIPAA